MQSDAENIKIPNIDVDGPVINSTISVNRESDLYSFRIDNHGFYTVRTEGSTDTFLTLLGPDDQTSEIPTDDDSGTLSTPRIRAQLIPGEYYARVRHYSDFGTGPYRPQCQQRLIK